MPFRRIITTLITLAAVALAAPPAPAQTGTLIVVNKGEDTASLIDLASGAEVARVQTGHGPHEVAVSPDGRTAVVTDYGTRENPGNTLSVIDLQSQDRIRVIQLGNHTRPHGVLFTPDGSLLAVTTEGSARLLVLETQDWQILQSLSTRAAVSHMVALRADGKEAYVANIRSGSVTVLDLELEEYVAQVRTGAGAEGIAVSPATGEIWVTNRADDTISVIDPSTLNVIHTLECASFPIRCVFTPDGRHLLVTCARSGDVAVVDAAERFEVARIRMELEAKDAQGRLFGDAFGQSPVPIGLLVHPSGAWAYVANAQADAIAVVDTASWTVVGLLRAGREPDGLGFSPLSLAAPADTIEAGS